jgi:EF hand
MKKAVLGTTFGAAVIAALAVSLPATAHADGKKHGYYGHGGGVYAPAPHVYGGGYYRPYRPYYGGAYVSGYRPYPYYAPYYRSRWVAPVAVAATIGGITVATSPYYYNRPVYAAPVYTTPTYVTSTYAEPYDAFSAADRDGDGFISYAEARYNGHFQRNFARMDYSGDGYLTREEVDAFHRR